MPTAAAKASQAINGLLKNAITEVTSSAAAAVRVNNFIWPGCINQQRSRAEDTGIEWQFGCL
jgi:hypothetical protein